MEKKKRVSGFIAPLSGKKGIGTVVVLLLLLSILLTLFYFHQQPGHQRAVRGHPASTPTVVQSAVTVDPTSDGIPVAPDFGGLSFEVSDSCKITNAAQQNPILLKLYDNLSPMVMRWGGASVSSTSWNPTGECSGTQISTTTIDQVLSLAKQVNSRVIWGINLQPSGANTFTDEASYAIQSGGSTLLAIEYGNEPNLNGGSYSSFLSNWLAYDAAMKAKVPDAPIAGPVTCCADNTWVANFTRDVGSKISLITQHIYQAGVDDSSQSITKLLSPSLENSTIDSFDGLVSIGKAHNLPVEIGETNSIANGGTSGVSDTMASALWGLDYMFTAAEQGITRINFHGGIDANDSYTPISTYNNIPYARPLYYAMLAFRYAVPNGKIVPVTLHSSLNLRAFGVVNTDGKLRVILINKDSSNSARVHIDTTQTYTKASAIRLTAPSVTTKANSNTDSGGIMLGGTAVAADGSWSPAKIEQVSLNGSISSITVSAASAVVVTYESGTGSLTPTFRPLVNPSKLTPSTIPAPTLFGSVPSPACLGDCPTLQASSSVGPSDTLTVAPSTASTSANISNILTLSTQPISSTNHSARGQPTAQPSNNPRFSLLGNHQKNCLDIGDHHRYYVGYLLFLR